MRRDGDLSAALELYGEPEAQCDNDPYRAHCLRHRGDMLCELGRPDEADVVLREAERLYRALADDPQSLANTLRIRAPIAGDADLWREARRSYEKAAVLRYDLQPAFDECDRQIDLTTI